MAKPIEPTPTIQGEEAKKFIEQAYRAVKEPISHREDVRMRRELSWAFGVLKAPDKRREKMRLA